LIEYISREIVPEDKKEIKQLLKKAARYTVVEGHLFRREISIPLLKCIGPSEVWYILMETYEGNCGHYVRARPIR
jgi:hypothetical protein